jgi:hypothetical protein
MAENYVLLETIELTQSASSVTFDNLPSTGYTDLKIVGSVRFASGGFDGIRVKPNNLTTNLSSKYLQGNGSTVVSGAETIAPEIGKATGADTASSFGNFELTIPNYTSSEYKYFSSDSVAESNTGTTYVNYYSARWASTAAITSLVLYNSSSTNFAQYSTFSLYGVAQKDTTPVTAPFATGGNIVANDGTYWYHAFLTSGTFTPLKTLSCNIVAVGGGGAGGSYGSGGGGAGGVVTWDSQSVTATAQTILIGAGAATDTSGNSSQFASLTAAIGGGKGSNNTATNGGSGGGGGYGTSSATTGTSTQTGTGATAFYGNSSGQASNNTGGAGGGGAGGAGSNGTNPGNQTGGAGGAGKNTWSAWLSATNLGVSGFIAGGGGGGGYAGASGGSGGAGNGGTISVAATAATINTGSGGGGGGVLGSSPGYDGGRGSSGLVLIRYLMA